MQIGTGGEHLVVAPDDHAFVFFLSQRQALQQAFDHIWANGVHLGLDAGDDHFIVQCPQTDRIIFMQRGACACGRRCVRTQHAFREMLTCIHRQAAHRHELASGRVPGTLSGVYATGICYRAFEHPFRQRCVAQSLACVDVFLDHVGHGQPACFLPELKRALLHAKTPAHAEVHVTGVVRNRAQMHGCVVECVAQNRPQELALRAFGVAQQLQTLGSWFFQHAGVNLVRLLTGGHILFAFQVKTHDVAPDLFEESGLGLLSQIAHVQQGLEHLGSRKTAVERVGFQTQGILQRLDDVGHGVQPHHVGGAESSRAGTTQLFAGQIVDHVIAQAKVFHFFHGGQHAGNADAVGDEVGSIFGTDDAFTQVAGDERFQVVEDMRLCSRRVDQFHQQHVAWGVEEMDAAKAGFEFLWEHFTELGDRQARGVGGHDGMWCDKRCNFFVQVKLPVHALSNRLNDEVAIAQLFQVLFVVGLTNQRCICGHTQRSRFEFFQAIHCFGDDAVFGAFFGRQIKQHDGYFAIDQMRCNLRTHHTCAKNGDFSDIESGHGEFL